MIGKYVYGQGGLILVLSAYMILLGGANPDSMCPNTMPRQYIAQVCQPLSQNQRRDVFGESAREHRPIVTLKSSGDL